MESKRINIIPKMGFKNSFIRTGQEADDIIAQLTIDYPGMTIVSNDKDLYQLLDNCITM